MTKQAKGSAFERQICCMLSQWWTEGRRSDIFWRTAGSGARATVRDRRGKSTSLQHGDVAATDPIGVPLIDLITIELKRGYANSSIQDLIDKTNLLSQQQYETWIDKAITSRKAAGSQGWILITRKDRRHAIVLMPRSLYIKLRRVNPHLYEPQSLFSFGFSLRKKNKKGKTIKKGNKRIIRIKGMLLSDFFNSFSRKDIESLA